MGVGSDSYPYTIHKVSDDKKVIWISADDHTWIRQPGTLPESEKGHYEFSNKHSKDESKWMKFTLRKNGRYVLEGSPMKDGRSIHIGHRSYYQDPSF